MSSAASPPPADLVALALVAGLILDTSSSAGTAWTFASSARRGANKKKSSRRKQARGTELPASLANLVSLVSVDGCGLGLIAKRAFSSGERILAEYPLLRWVVSADDIGSGGEVSPAALDRQVEALEDAKRVAYFSLSQSAMFGTEKSAGGIWMCNAFPVPGENEAQRGVQSAGVFEVICRINHSCSPNTHHQWNTKLGKTTLHAIRPISHGEEITIAYWQAGFTRAERGVRAMQRFGFDCRCSLCVLNGDEGRRSDERQRRIGELAARISESPHHSAEIIALVEERARLLSEEGLPDNWALADFHRCMMQRERCGDRRGAKLWARRARDRALVSGGDDCPSYLLYEAASRRH